MTDFFRLLANGRRGIGKQAITVRTLPGRAYLRYQSTLRGENKPEVARPSCLFIGLIALGQCFQCLEQKLGNLPVLLPARASECCCDVIR
jgi:hypothetical protein